jgi:pilus assembly protein CpaC
VNFSDLLNLFAFRPDLNIGATIKALQEHNLLQILAEPNLIAVEGTQATFLAGGSFPFPTITTTPTGGATAPVITVQFKPFGVKLEFTPTVTPQGAIDLKVAPEVSSLDYANAVTLDGFLIPALSQRRAETEVILKDGESFAIAGLIDNRVIETLSKVPGLGDLPVIGKIFRSRSTQKSADELLVVVTPYFVKPLTPDEKAKLPVMPSTFLPAAVPPGTKKGKGGKTSSTQNNVKDPEFVGPRGQQIPKQ